MPSAVADFGAWPVRVSQHALQQAAERAGVSSRATIAEQVSAALEEGRVSAQRPPWLARRVRSRPGSELYAWREDNSAAFVLIAGADHFLVVTTLTPTEGDAKAA